MERVEFGGSEESDNTPVLEEDVVVSATPEVRLFGLAVKAASEVEVLDFKFRFGWILVPKEAGVGLGSGF